MPMTTSQAITRSQAAEQTRQLASQPSCWVEVTGLAEASGVTHDALAFDPWTNGHGLDARTTVALVAARTLGIAWNSIDPLSMFPGRGGTTLIISITREALDASIPNDASNPVRVVSACTRDRSNERGPYEDVVSWSAIHGPADTPATQLAVGRLLTDALRAAAADEGLGL